MGLDLLLVHPSTRKRVYQGKESFAAKEPPYLAALTAGFVRSQGYDVRILDADAENLDVRETIDKINEYNPSLIQIVVHGQQPSASTQMMTSIGNLCGSIKTENPHQKILLTGNHPSALPKRTLEEGACDFVGRGEAYRTVLGLLENNPLENVPGLFFRDNGKISFGKIEGTMSSAELDNHLPSAAWDLLPMEKYRAHEWHVFYDEDKRGNYASISTSFGCGMGCEFCMIDDMFTVGGTERSFIRHRSPKIVVDEIETLVNEYGVRNLKIIDEMFIFNKRHYLGVAERIIERGLNLNIWCYARIDTVRDNTLETLKKAGFNWFGMGIEAGNEEVRNDVDKGKKINKERIREVMSKVEDAGIEVGANYIFGLPKDTFETIQETFNLATELNAVYSNFYCAMAYPGSELHRQASAGNYSKPKDWPDERPLLPEDENGPGWIGYSQHAYETLPLPTKTLYPEEVLRFRDDSFMNYFTNERYLGMIRSKFGERTEQSIKDMTSSPRLKRKLLGHGL